MRQPWRSQMGEGSSHFRIFSMYLQKLLCTHMPMKQIQQSFRGGILRPHNIKRLGRKCDDGCFRRRVIIRQLLNMFIDVKGPTSLEFVTTCKIYAEVIENAWPQNKNIRSSLKSNEFQEYYCDLTCYWFISTIWMVISMTLQKTRAPYS